MSVRARLFPLTIVRTEPPPFQSADCKAIGVGDDGLTYVLKSNRDGPNLALTEYVCTRLAEVIGLAVPNCQVAMLPNGDSCFASREEGGVQDQLETSSMFTHAPTMTQLSPRFSEWFAFDLFTQNVDRHFGNYLFRRGMLGVSLLGMDFSRAFLAHTWPLRPPPLGWCNTTRCQQALKGMGVSYSSSDALKVLTRIEHVDSEWFRALVHAVPPTWLDAKLASQLTAWWSCGRRKRLKVLKRNFANGRYFQILAHSRNA